MPVGQGAVSELGLEVNAQWDRDRAVRRIQRDLGFRTDRAQEIVESLQEAQDDLERGTTLPRFLIKEAQTLTLAAGSQTVDLPSDFLRRTDRRPYYQRYAQGYQTRLEWQDYEIARDTFYLLPTGYPRAISLLNDTIYFFPVANQSFTIYWDYYQKAAVLDTNVTNLWLEKAPMLLVSLAGMKIAGALRNKTAMELFSAQYLQQKQRWLNETAMQERDDLGSHPVMGGNN